MDSAQTNVAGAALVASSFFEMEEESRDTLDRKSFDSKLAGVAIFPRDKLQQQFETVTVAVERVRTQGSLTG
jgi:hypothetical protein